MPPATRRPVTRQKTPALIVEVAEALWGERGLDGVSLREISLAAGLSNPASVQYHFGGKDALIWAIFSSRLPAIDARRALLFAHCDGQERPADMRTLLDCLFRPLAEQRNAAGRPGYAAFLRQVLRHDAAAGLRERAMAMTPATDILLQRIVATGPALPQPLAAHRLIAINLLVLDVIARLDAQPPWGLSADSLYEDAIDMAAGALTALPLRSASASLPD